MARRPTKYKRCPKCKELVNDVENCAVCASKNPLSLNRVPVRGNGKVGAPTLDKQEGNREEL